MKHVRTYIIFWCLCTLNVQAQSINISLESVFCHAPEMADCWVAFRRPPDYLLRTEQTTMVWRKKPIPPANTPFSGSVAYVSGCKARLSAKFSIPVGSCSSKPIYIKAEAEVANQIYKLPPMELDVDGSRGDYKMKEFDQSFEQFKVQYLPNFIVKWYYTCDPSNENSWELVGISTNVLYIVHQKPVEGNEGLGEKTSFLQDCLHMSCKIANGKGISGHNAAPDDIVNEIYNEFRTRCVKKMSGTKCMAYWGNTATAQSCLDIKDFLSTEDGACNEWAKIFHDMLRLQGIIGSNITLVTYGDESGDHGFLPIVHQNRLNQEMELFFGAEAANVKPLYLPSATAGFETTPVTLLFIKNHSFTSVGQHFYLYGEPTSASSVTVPATNKTLLGTNGQRILAQGDNNDKSPGDFLNHTIVQYANNSGIVTYFDPSYGTINMAAIPWESSGMAGFGIRLTYKKGNDLIDIMWIAEIDNPQAQQTTFKFN